MEADLLMVTPLDYADPWENIAKFNIQTKKKKKKKKKKKVKIVRDMRIL
jgi:hypothetical protein